MVGPKRILCPVDLSELSMHALAWAGRIAESCGSDLAILHVLPPFEPMEVRAPELFEPVQFVYPITTEETEERLREAVRAAGLTADRVSVAARAGEPAEVILDELRAAGADLVVMGTHGRGGWDHGWDRPKLGSVAESVLRSAPCPVLAVPPSGTGDVSGR